MAKARLSMRKIKETLRLRYQCGLSRRQVARSVKASRSTVAAFEVTIEEEIQSATQEILTQFPRLVGAMKDRGRADPFVIALAKVKIGTVVTGERNSGTRNRPRIPNVCDHFGIGHQTLLQLIRDKGWTFRYEAVLAGGQWSRSTPPDRLTKAMFRVSTVVALGPISWVIDGF